MENNEKGDWKPEVGKTAWVILAMDVHEVNVTNVTAFGYYTVSSERWNEHDMPAEWVFPTPEAALASIKIYDLEGKEVVIPRARDFHDGEMPLIDVAVSQKTASLLATANAWLGGNGGGAAIGGKSDQREGGC